MKITITQEAEASKPQVDALQQLQWRQPIIKKRWVILAILVLLLMYSWQQHLTSLWVILPLLWNLALLNMVLVARSRRKTLHKIEQAKLHSIFWLQLRQQYPELNLQQRKLIEQGFKDYLALHAMQKQAYAMPSHAVDALWHVMLQYPKHYQQLCEQTIGRTLQHQPYDANITAADQNKQLFESWRISCQLHGFNPRNTSQLPRLFAIDQALNWQGGQDFELQGMTQEFAKYLSSQSNSSSSCGSSCSSCGGGGD